MYKPSRGLAWRPTLTSSFPPDAHRLLSYVVSSSLCCRVVVVWLGWWSWCGDVISQVPAGHARRRPYVTGSHGYCCRLGSRPPSHMPIFNVLSWVFWQVWRCWFVLNDFVQPSWLLRYGLVPGESHSPKDSQGRENLKCSAPQVENLLVQEDFLIFKSSKWCREASTHIWLSTRKERTREKALQSMMGVN